VCKIGKTVLGRIESGFFNPSFQSKAKNGGALLTPRQAKKPIFSLPFISHKNGTKMAFADNRNSAVHISL
jgi:hypothetical protein